MKTTACNGKGCITRNDCLRHELYNPFLSGYFSIPPFIKKVKDDGVHFECSMFLSKK